MISINIESEEKFIQNIQQIDKLEIKFKKKTKNNKITEIINFYHNNPIFIIIKNNSLLIRVLFFTFVVFPLLHFYKNILNGLINSNYIYEELIF